MTESSQSPLLLHFTRNGAYADGAHDLLVLERGEGPYVFDSAGRRYLDGMSSLYCSQLGYSYGSEFAAAATEQLQRLSFNSNWSTATPAALELAARLQDLAPLPGARVFFTSGGAESVEAAWKLARQYHVARGEPDRTKAIARDVAYHGVTLGALALTGVERFRAEFGPPAIPVRHVANTNSFRREGSAASFCGELLQELEAAILEEGAETISLIIAEPIQNAGGCLVPPARYWQGLREISDRYGILLVADEVITAMGRLGHWFGSERLGAEPDIVTIAKGLTSAHVPMGAVLLSEEVAAHLYADERTLLHGLTFGGHPVCAAIALRNLELFESEGVLENVRSLEAHLERRMRELFQLPLVGDVRGAGFFWAAELVKDEGDARFDSEEREQLLRGFLPRAFLRAGLIARADDRGDSVIHVAPPLICTREQLDEMVDRLADSLEQAERHLHRGTSAVEVA